MNIIDLLAPNESILGFNYPATNPNTPSDTAQFKVPRGTLLFMQMAYTQGFTSILRALIGPTYSTSTVYVLYGCDISTINTAGNTSYYTFKEGAIFYNDEIFIYNGGSAVVTANTTAPVFSVLTLPYNGDGTDADPVTYTDGTVHNIHTVRNITILPGSPSGPMAYAQANFLDFAIPPPLNLTGMYGATVSPSSDYPNIVVNVNKVICPVLTAGTQQINSANVPNTSGPGDVPNNDGMEQAIQFDTPLLTRNYYVIGTLRGLSSDANTDATVFWVLRDASISTTGFSIWLCEISGNPYQDLYFDYIVFAQP